ncbi:MAG: hypothetical protein HOQ24_11455 [Mycobacteriaceae bacterium]|nr:hypothetical protein [Mycobacteriaceae bacterium]
MFAVGAMASAADGVIAVPGNAGLVWTRVTDSGGVRLSDYMFATKSFDLMSMGESMLAVVLQFEFVGWIVVVTTAIWLIGFAIGFQWLDAFRGALQGTAQLFAFQVATPMMLAAATSIGAVCVGWFVVRGYTAKAVSQVVTMLAVAILGPMFLAEPLGDVLSPDGLLAKGRNLGIAVAAGLNGNSRPDPGYLVSSMQAGLADNFARRPLQIWNLGYVVDGNAACKQAWNAGVAAGSPDQLKKNLAACGAAGASTLIDHPSPGQLGTGLLLLICGTVLVLFAAFLAAGVMWAALDSIYHGFRAILGFAAGGFVYGPTQTALARDVVDSMVAAATMCAYVIYLGVYVLFLGNLFRQVGSAGVMAVMVTGAVVEVVAIVQFRRLRRGLGRGNKWIADKFAATAQGRPSGGGGAVGMGDAGTGRSLPAAALATLAVVNTIDANPIAANLLLARNPLQYMARRRQQAESMNIDMTVRGWPREAQLRGHLDRSTWAHAAARRARLARAAGADEIMTLANAVDGIGDLGAPDSVYGSVLESAGFDRDMINAAMRVRAFQRVATSGNQRLYPQLQKARAALGNVQAQLASPDAASFRAWYVVTSSNWLSKIAPPLDRSNVNHDFVRMVEANWDNPHALHHAVPDALWLSQNRDTLHHIGHRLASENMINAQAFAAAPTAANLEQAARTMQRAHVIDSIAGPLTASVWA